MQISFNVVKKNFEEIRMNDLVLIDDKPNMVIAMQINVRHQMEFNEIRLSEQPCKYLKKQDAPVFDVLERVSEPESPQNPWERLAEMYPDGVTVRDLREKHDLSLMYTGWLRSVDGIQRQERSPHDFNLSFSCDAVLSLCSSGLFFIIKFRDHPDPNNALYFRKDGFVKPIFNVSTPNLPQPEQEIIPIKGVKHVITRKPCGGWSDPVLWGPQVGDEVELGQLKEGDRVLIEGFITEFDCDGDARVQFGDLNKYYRPTQKVIYNGKSES